MIRDEMVAGEVGLVGREMVRWRWEQKTISSPPLRGWC